MKRLAAVQVLLGFLIVFFSLVSILDAYWVAPPHGGTIVGPNGTPGVIMYTYPPQSPTSTWAAAIAGLVVVSCGLPQKKKAIKYANGQIFSGVISAFSSTILGHAISNQPWIFGNINYLSVLALVSGLVVIMLGFLQSGLRLFPTKKKREIRIL